jgi:hypothetical protein
MIVVDALARNRNDSNQHSYIETFDRRIYRHKRSFKRCVLPTEDPNRRVNDTHRSSSQKNAKHTFFFKKKNDRKGNR